MESKQSANTRGKCISSHKRKHKRNDNPLDVRRNVFRHLLLA